MLHHFREHGQPHQVHRIFFKAVFKVGIEDKLGGNLEHLRQGLAHFFQKAQQRAMPLVHIAIAGLQFLQRLGQYQVEDPFLLVFE